MTPMYNKLHAGAALLLGIFLALRVDNASAAVVVAPALSAGTYGNTTLGEFQNLPARTNGQHFQTLYAASLFRTTGPASGPIYITEIAYRPAAGVAPFSLTIPNLVIMLSTTQVADDQLSTTFASNFGPDATVVSSGPVQFSSAGATTTAPGNFDVFFKLATPFLYDPSRGNLLVDMEFAGQATGTGGAIDGQDGAGDGVSRMRTAPGIANCGVDVTSPTGCNLNNTSSGIANTSRAPVTQFSVLSPNAVLAPAGIGAMGNATMGEFQLPQSARFQTLYASSFFGGPTAPPVYIKQFAYRPAAGQPAFSQTISNVLITLATSSAQDDGLNPTFIANMNPDATIVMNGQLTLSSAGALSSTAAGNFDIYFAFSQPFLYDPSKGNLLVDMQFTGPTTGTGGLIDAQDGFSDGLTRMRTSGGIPGCGVGVNSPSGCSSSYINGLSAAIETSRGQVTQFLVQPVTIPIVTTTAPTDASSGPVTTAPTLGALAGGGSPAVLTFSSVAASGTTSVSTSITPPVAPAFTTACTPEVNLQITTTASYNNSVTICVDPTQFGASCTGLNSLWHFDPVAAAWTQLPRPAYTPVGQICGVTSSFSPFSVLAPAQTLTFPAIAGVAVNAPPFAVSASSSAGLPVTFNTFSPEVCKVANSVVTPIAYGNCTIAVSQPGNDNYPPAGQLTQTFPITALQQQINFLPLGAQILGIAPFTVGATSTSGLTVTLTSQTPGVCGVVGGVVSLLAVGTCTLAANQAGNSTYASATEAVQSFGVAAALMAQTINLTTPASVALASSPITITANATSGLSVVITSLTLAICQASSSTIALLAAGTCTLQATQAGNASYAPAPTLVTSITVQAQSGSGGTGGDSADVPLPLWALLLLGGGIAVRLRKP